MIERQAAPDSVRRVMQAMRTSSPVVLTYQGADHDRPHQFLLYPRRLFGRNGHRYVEGWSKHRPSRIMLCRFATGDPGCVRQFRFDRTIACEAMPRWPRTPREYVVEKIRRRGVAMAVWGWFLDLCVIGMLVRLVLGMLRLARLL